MDPTTASYYRAILFFDSQDQRPLPPSLVVLHAWAFKRIQAMGAGSVISKQGALGVAMTWMSTTQDGRAFTRESTTLGDIFGEIVEDQGDALLTGDEDYVDWSAVAADTKVIVIADGKKAAIGEFIGKRSSWIDVRIGGEKRSFRANQVQLAGA